MGNAHALTDCSSGLDFESVWASLIDDRELLKKTLADELNSKK